MYILFYSQSVKVKVKSLSHVLLFAIPWTVAYQVPPSTGFSRQEYRRGFPFPSPSDLPDPGIEPRSPTLEADTLTYEPPGNGKLSKILDLRLCPQNQNIELARYRNQD